MLLSQSLFIDHEYKADCEKKINYLSVIDKNEDFLTLEHERVSKNEEYLKSTSTDLLNRTKEISFTLKKLIEEY